MMPPFCTRGAPPWWPAGEPWPPRHRRFGMDPRTRARFFRRAAFAALVFVTLVISAIAGAAWMIAGRFGLAGWMGAIPVALAAVAVIAVIVMMAGAMRRFAFPLGAIMDAADRVADGNYAVRVQEHGPPPVRALAHSFNTMTERLQNADRLRRNLMADVAHELRTPLSVLQGRVEGLIDGVYPRDDGQLSQLLEDTHVLSRLVDDLRTVALSDAGALPLQKEAIHIARLVQDVVQSMEGEAGRKNVSLKVDAPARATALAIDPLRIREVLTNLLSNAIRHTAPGRSVTVAVRDSEGAVTVAVSDTGSGMSPEDAARMFDRFYKGPASQGSGLGLAIAKGIVTAHGGEIGASSLQNRGTTVTFTLPRES